MNVWLGIYSLDWAGGCKRFSAIIFSISIEVMAHRYRGTSCLYSSSSAYYNRGNAYYAKNDYDHAIADYSQALQLDPNNLTYYNNRGLAYYAKNDYDRAAATTVRRSSWLSVHMVYA